MRQVVLLGQRSLVRAAAAAVVCGLSLPAMAQGGPDSREDAGGVLEEVVVTAQKREERLFDVPISMAAFSGDFLSETQVNNLRDLQTISPNLIVAQSTDRASGFFFMRGVGTGIQDRGFEQSVGVYIDGIYRGRAGAALQDFMDIERVEVLRGPQSTLFGRNNLVGAVSVVTKAPSYTLEGTGEATYGDFDQFQVRASLSGPIVADKVAFRFSAQHMERGAFLENLTPGGNDTDATETQSYRGQLLFDISEDTSLRLIGDYSRVDDECCGLSLRFMSDAAATGIHDGFTPPGSGTPGVMPGTDAPGTFYDAFARRIADDGPHRQTIDDWGLSAELNHDFGGVTLTTLASYRSFESLLDTDIMFSDTPVIKIVVTTENDFVERSFESRLANSDPGPLDWVIGLYYFDQELIEDNSFLSVGGHYRANQENDSLAVFGQGTWHASDRLSLTAGLRFLQEEKSSVTVGVPPGTSLGTDGTVVIDDDELMGTVSLAYSFSDRANTYLKYARGYLAGATNLFISGPDIQENPSVRPSTSDSYEIGGKFRLLDNRLSIDAAIFRQTLDDQQVQANIPDPNGGSLGIDIVENAAEIKTEGMELEFGFVPTEQLSLSAGVVYLDSRYGSYPGAPVPLVSDESTQDLTGQRPFRSPEWTVTGNATFEQPLPGGGLTLISRVAGRYASDHTTDVPNDPLFVQDDALVLDASLMLLADTWSVQLWSKNLTDEDTIRGGAAMPAAPNSFGYWLGDPRTYGLTVRAWF